MYTVIVLHDHGYGMFTHKAEDRAKEAYDELIKKKNVIAAFLYAPDSAPVQYTFCRA